jgi:hypothetical protein
MEIRQEQLAMQTSIIHQSANQVVYLKSVSSLGRFYFDANVNMIAI